jgi:hypothetical protein
MTSINDNTKSDDFDCSPLANMPGLCEVEVDYEGLIVSLKGRCYAKDFSPKNKGVE